MNLYPLRDLVWRYRDLLHDVWPTPPPDVALAFAVTEAGEAVDAWLRTEPRWARNNDKAHDEADEWADCLMMLVTAAERDSNLWENVPAVGVISRARTVEWIATAWDSNANWYSIRCAIAAVIRRIGGQDKALRLVESRLRRIAAKFGRELVPDGVRVYDYTEADDA